MLPLLFKTGKGLCALQVFGYDDRHMSNTVSYDVVVVGAGVFGAWTAWHLANRGQRVLLAEAYGAAHSRASSGGESRIIRMSYGRDEIYTRWSQNSLTQWKKLFAATGQKLFVPTGVLWLASESDEQLRQSKEVLKRCGITHDVLSHAELVSRYPQVNFEGITEGVLEPDSGVLLARRAVACVVDDAIRMGAQFEIAEIVPPSHAQQIRFDHHGRRKANLCQAVCVCVRSVAGQSFSRTAWATNISHAARSLFLRQSSR